MPSNFPPNVPPPGPNKPGASASPDFSLGIPTAAPGHSPSVPSGKPAPTPTLKQPPSPNVGIEGAAGFTTHIPELRNTFATPDDNADHSAYYDSLNPRPPMSSGMKGIIVAVVVICGFFGYRLWRGGSSALADWGGNWEKQVDQSAAERKPQLVLFTADWCPACEDFEDKVLSRKDVTAKLQEQFILTKVDLSSRGGPNTQIAQTFGVKVIPTLVIVGPDGSRSDFLTGSVSEQRLYEWIGNRKLNRPR